MTHYIAFVFYNQVHRNERDWIEDCVKACLPVVEQSVNQNFRSQTTRETV